MLQKILQTILKNFQMIHLQSFFKDYMGVNLVMEPNFSDYSCQVNFSIL